jgi:predicted transposase/invertase (TIGR01784 family)
MKLRHYKLRALLAVLRKMSMTREEWARDLSRRKQDYEYFRNMHIARRQGEEKGERKGEEKGERKAQLRVARNLKADGLPLEMIAKNTGLSLNEISAL